VINEQTDSLEFCSLKAFKTHNLVVISAWRSDLFLPCFFPFFFCQLNLISYLGAKMPMTQPQWPQKLHKLQFNLPRLLPLLFFFFLSFVLFLLRFVVSFVKKKIKVFYFLSFCYYHHHHFFFVSQLSLPLTVSQVTAHKKKITIIRALNNHTRRKGDPEMGNFRPILHTIRINVVTKGISLLSYC